MWLSKVKKYYGDKLELDWVPFLLDQVNSNKGPDWYIWEQPDHYPSRSLLALRAGECVKRQEGERFESFLLAMMKARHEARRDLSDIGVVLEIALSVGIDVSKLRMDLKDQDILKTIGEGHIRAVDEYGVFGVPTYVFDGKGSVFLKILEMGEEEVVPTFKTLRSLATDRLYVGEIKRPQPPWPKGIYS